MFAVTRNLLVEQQKAVQVLQAKRKENTCFNVARRLKRFSTSMESNYAFITERLLQLAEWRVVCKLIKR